MRKIIILFLLSSVCLAAGAAGPGTTVVVVDEIRYQISSSIVDGLWTYPGQAAVIPKEEGFYSGTIVIPNKITVNEGFIHGDFYVTGIRYDAFQNCESLESVTIPAGVTQFAKSGNTCPPNPLYGCTNLKQIVVEEDNSVFDSRDNCNAIIQKNGNILIAGCKYSTIPSTVKSIGISAFFGCSGLLSIDFPDGLERIRGGAFENCSGLQTISLPSSVHGINAKAFNGCSGLRDFFCYSKPSLTGYDCIINAGDNFPEYEIDGDIFDSSANNAVLHVRDIDIEDFKSDEQCNVFKEIVPIEIVTDFTITYFIDNAEYKKEQHKYNDDVIPDIPTRNGYSFSGWSYTYTQVDERMGSEKKVTIDIPAKMPGKDIKVEGTFIRNEVKEDNVIYWAKNENAVVIGNDNAAGEVEILSAVEFNEKEFLVNVIDDNAFKSCAGITKINIPATITKIGERAFANIDKLTDVIILATDLPETDRTAFENSYIEDYVTLHVTEASLEKYKTTAPWKNFKSVVAIAGTQKLPAPTVSFENGVLTFTCGVEDVKYNWTISSGGSQPSSVGSDKLSFPNVTNHVLSVYATKEGYVNSETTTVSIHVDRADVNRDGKVDAADHVELTKVIMSYDSSETENNTTIEPYDDPTDL